MRSGFMRRVIFFARTLALSAASAGQALVHSAYERANSAPEELPEGAAVLVVQLGQIGDFVLTTPLTAALKASGAVEVAVLADPVTKPLADADPNVDVVICYASKKYSRKGASGTFPSEELKKRDFDRVFWLRGDARTFAWVVFRRLPMRGVTRLPNPLRKAWAALLTGRSLPQNGYVHFVEGLDHLGLPEAPSGFARPFRVVDINTLKTGRRKVCVHVGAGTGLRHWPEDNFAALVTRLLEWDGELRITLVGSFGERPIAERIRNMVRLEYLGRVANDCGGTRLDELRSLFTTADLFIGFDSGPMHIAALSGVPVVAMMGPQSPAVFGPWSDNASVIHKGEYCSPCWQFGCLHSVELNAPGMCVSSITPDEVFTRAVSILERRLRHAL